MASANWDIMKYIDNILNVLLACFAMANLYYSLFSEF